MAKQRTYNRNSGGRDVSRRNSGRARPRKKAPSKIPAGLVFWTAFLVFIAGLFFINRDRIRESLESTQLVERLFSGFPEQIREPPAGQDSFREPDSSGEPPSGGTRRPEPDPRTPPAQPDPGLQARPGTVQSNPRPIEQRGAPTPPVSAPASPSVAGGSGTPPAARTDPPPRRPGETADQSLYFIHVEDDGTILRNRVTRRIPVSGTPLMDTLGALIAGPNPGEIRQGMISLIPPDTKILGVAIEGGTARINFSEEFQYNTAGMEGFAAQLTQIVWTATEFPNVGDVQILIEGNRVDHLGEGVPIWSPLNRQSF